MTRLGAHRSARRFAAAGLPRHPRRPLRRHLLHRDGRGRRPRLLAHLLPERARLLKPGGRACVQSIVIDDALFERYIAPPTSSSSTSSGRLPALPARIPRPGAPRGWRWWTNSPLAPTTPKPCGAGARPSWRQRARCCGSVLMSGSCASGSSTWPTAKRPSTWATSTWCSTRCKSAMDRRPCCWPPPAAGRLRGGRGRTHAAGGGRWLRPRHRLGSAAARVRLPGL
jgi:hypothetical protein